ncbi:EamA family transporter RarD [Propioniciclava sp.]|uniref:EamA family transporter RarD n=1 Tax=Propioniciclava sp. TaxID=2038686 RepID=UPI002626C50F|nr:EamA family transporter RarD [Propioniciclava sp.]
MPDRPAPSPNAPPVPDAAHERSLGLASGVSAYLIWGFFPLLFALVAAAGPLEILAHRVVWSLAAVSLALALLRRPWGWLRTVFRGPRFVRLVAATVLVAVNWLTFIWAVNSGHVVEASLGYFINPLLNIALGVVLFGERMRRTGAIGAALALAGVIVIGWQNWATLWVSLLLAGSFASYGAVKKRAPLPPLEGLFVESALLAPLAIGYLVVLGATGAGLFGTQPAASGFLVLAGVLTALPLWLFAIAATRLEYGVLGILQYLGPTIQFILGLTVFGQHVGPTYWAGLVFVWCGSAVYLSGALRRSRVELAPR